MSSIICWLIGEKKITHFQMVCHITLITEIHTSSYIPRTFLIQMSLRTVDIFTIPIKRYTSSSFKWTKKKQQKNMKIFSTLQKIGALIGIGPHQHPFNWLSLLVFLIDCFGIFINCAYFFCKAKTIQQYAESIYVGTTCIAITICYAITARMMREMVDCLNEAEKIIDSSELGWYFNRINSHT